MDIQLSEELKNIISYAREEAVRLGNIIITTDHLILGMIRHWDNAAVKILESLKINPQELKKFLEEALFKKNRTSVFHQENIPFSKAAEIAFEGMDRQRRLLGQSLPYAEHLLISIFLQDGWSFTCDFVREAGLERSALLDMTARYCTEHADSEENGKVMDDQKGEDLLIEITDEAINNLNEENVRSENQVEEGIQETEITDETGNEGKPEEPNDPDGERYGNYRRQRNQHSFRRSETGSALSRYGFDLTKAAAENKLDPVIGREKEIERLAQILGRRKKNNPVLIGEPGVGKSAIAEGLAVKIAKKEVSKALRNKRIISLDIGSVVAGTKYRGQFEERIKHILAEIRNTPDIILFIDELHTLVGAGNADGSLDAANMLKPALSRGEFQCIGATTLDEYREFIEKDGALERRFQKIMVEPTNYLETLEILNNIKERYESFHNVIYTDEAIKACVRLSERYITERCLPDKAIDMLDEAGSRVHLRNMKTPKKITELEEKAELYRSQKAEAADNSDFERAAMFRDLEKMCMAELGKYTDMWEKREKRHPVTVNKEDIAEVLSIATNIPVNKIAESESNRLMNMQSILSGEIIGQDEAIEKVTKAIRRSRAGLKDPEKPIGTFLFLGPTGVGKTQLAKKLARYLFDTQEALIRIDMSEYMEKYAVSRLIGAPPGYVGYNEGGELTERVRRKPYSVVLLDEIEKAHPDIFNILLQVLDEGRLTDSSGRRIDFRNTVLIMTSNIGSRELKEFGKGLGFANSSRQDIKEREIIDKALNKTFSPEFLNRLDDQILFNTLTLRDLEKIIDIELAGLYSRVEQAGYKLKITPAAKKFVAAEGYDRQYGARPLKRAIQRYIEDLVAEAIISNRTAAGGVIEIGMNRDRENPSTVIR